MKIHVACHAGYKGEETPRSIRFDSRKITVKSVLDQWLAPDHRYFKLLGDDNAIYIIRHDTASHGWELAFFEQE